MRGVGRFGEVLWLAAAVGCVAATAVALGAQEGAPAAGVPRPTGGAGAPAAQERNLQILPKDISRQELGEIMQGFARSLGVGCDHCHTGESMETMDWGNDDKDTKKSAREMMRLVRTINDGLTGLTRRTTRAHRSVAKRATAGSRCRRVPSATSSRIRRSPADRTQAVAEYNRLHVEAGDAGRYNFRERALNTAARRLREKKRLPDAIALLRKNASLFPPVCRGRCDAGQHAGRERRRGRWPGRAAART